MKKITPFLLVLGCSMTLGLSCPVKASSPVPIGKMRTTNGVLSVTEQTASGFEHLTLVGTLEDGTLLGFSLQSSGVCLDGIITTSSSLSVPEQVVLDETTYPVIGIGHLEKAEFVGAVSLKTMDVPASVSNIQSLPVGVKSLVIHDAYETSAFSEEVLNQLEELTMSQALLENYQQSDAWKQAVRLYAEGYPAVDIELTVTEENTLESVLTKQVTDWSRVRRITVTGPLSSEDLSLFNRLTQVVFIDISATTSSWYAIPEDFTAGSHLHIEEVLLPPVWWIGGSAFKNCTRLRKITIPSAQGIGDKAFAYCGLREIDLPDDLNELGESAFLGSELERISIPAISNGIIEEYCFQNCANLKEVVLPVEVKVIMREAFKGSGLERVVLPGVETVYWDAFSGCTMLQQVEFGDRLQKIEQRAFEGCSSLIRLELPAKLLKIGWQALNCPNLSVIVCHAQNVPNVDSGLLNYCADEVTLYVPSVFIDQYKDYRGWSSATSIEPIEDRITELVLTDHLMVEDPLIFKEDCELTLDWRFNDDTFTSNKGALIYTGSNLFKIGNLTMHQKLGRAFAEDEKKNQYYGHKHPALYAAGPVQVDDMMLHVELDDPNMWYFFSLPYDVRVEDIFAEDDQISYIIRGYSGANRAAFISDTWYDMLPGSVLHAYQGYIIRSARANARISFPSKGVSFTSESISIPLQKYISELPNSSSWNLVGNPYPTFYDIQQMEWSAPLLIWNREELRYDAYSPIDDQLALHPFQSFFVQCPDDKSSVKFSAKGRHVTENRSSWNKQSETRSALSSDRRVLNLTLTDGTRTDRTRVVWNERATLGYEQDKDAPKWFEAGGQSPLLYTVVQGERYAINERPLTDGEVQLGFYAPKAGDYILSMQAMTGANYSLYDHKTGVTVPFTGEYQFHTEAGFQDKRITLRTGSVTSNNRVETEPSIRIGLGTVLVDQSFVLFAADGHFIGSYAAGETARVQAGIYIVTTATDRQMIIVSQ